MAYRFALRLLLSVAVLSVVLPAAMVVAEGPTDGAADSTGRTSGPKQTARRWLKRYRTRQVLFHDEDMNRLDQKLSDATPEQAQQWLDETEDIRMALGSAEWKNTQRWLRDFFRVQAIYSDEQIDQLRREAKETAKKSPRKFIDLLLEIEEKRKRMVAGGAGADRLRQQKLDLVQAYKQEQIANRANRPRPAGLSTEGTKPKLRVKRSRSARPPLVSSLDVARASVMRSFWQPW